MRDIQLKISEVTRRDAELRARRPPRETGRAPLLLLTAGGENREEQQRPMSPSRHPSAHESARHARRITRSDRRVHPVSAREPSPAAAAHTATMLNGGPEQSCSAYRRHRPGLLRAASHIAALLLSGG
ncbi:hypothetical protein GCM10022244_04720 [Streptomyces gulbargensis]|uniref:Uncharacterized protein n=1 Tax=Streptomyces gulbargensis TaxID=364901 RepID=A0ABP7L9H9_9ACTN